MTNDQGSIARSWQPYLVLAMGVSVVSWAAVFIRVAGAPPLVTGAYRLTIASLLLTPLALWRNSSEMLRLDAKDMRLIIASGVFLGLHFATWISSLAYTSVASSVVLVSLNPIFVGLAAHFGLKERVSARMFLGIALAVLGSAVVGWGDLSLSARAMWGDLLAVFGAMMVSVYLLIGRSVRRRVSLLAYVTLTYGTAALVLVIAALWSRQAFTGYPARSYLMFLLLAIGPQMLGHSSFNWALRYLSPTFVAAAVLGEPIGSTALAFWILHETVSAAKILGGVIILVGIYMCARAEAAKGWL